MFILITLFKAVLEV